jgi:hypothetical protein
MTHCPPLPPHAVVPVESSERSTPPGWHCIIPAREGSSRVVARSRGDLLHLVRAFDHHPLVQPGPSAYQRDQVWPVDRPPAVLGGFQQLERQDLVVRRRGGMAENDAAVDPFLDSLPG